MFFFKRKPLPPLMLALRLIQEASEIAMKHKRDKTYRPTEEDLVLFQRIEDRLEEAKATAAYVNRCMNQRFNGEPEGAKKWHNDEVFDYHYPP